MFIRIVDNIKKMKYWIYIDLVDYGTRDSGNRANDEKVEGGMGCLESSGYVAC